MTTLLSVLSNRLHLKLNNVLALPHLSVERLRQLQNQLMLLAKDTWIVTDNRYVCNNGSHAPVWIDKKGFLHPAEVRNALPPNTECLAVEHVWFGSQSTMGYVVLSSEHTLYFVGILGDNHIHLTLINNRTVTQVKAISDIGYLMHDGTIMRYHGGVAYKEVDALYNGLYIKSGAFYPCMPDVLHSRAVARSGLYVVLDDGRLFALWHDDKRCYPVNVGRKAVAVTRALDFGMNKGIRCLLDNGQYITL